VSPRAIILTLSLAAALPLACPPAGADEVHPSARTGANPRIGAGSARPAYIDPVDCVADPRAARAYVALAGRCAVGVVDVRAERLVDTWTIPGEPTGLALSPDRSRLAVTLGRAAGEIVLLDVDTGLMIRRFAGGFSPRGPVFLDGRTLAVCNRFADSVGLYRLPDGLRVGGVAVSREPVAAVCSPGGGRLLVACHLPAQPATADHVAASVEVVDVASRRVVERIVLPNGATGLRDVALAPDGRVAYVSHTIGHHQVPTNQLERGWMNVNALSVIDLADANRLGTVLLDDITLGAANPWGVEVSPDGNTLVVAHYGSHALSLVPTRTLLDVVARGRVAARGEPDRPSYGPGLEHELRTMQVVGRRRIELAGEGPRGVAVAAGKALVCEYFSGSLGAVDLHAPASQPVRPRQIDLGDEPARDAIRNGQLRFADARLCFQQWQSCVSCHPDARADGLNWDLLNDGVGNPKQTKSMLLAHKTPPAMSLGVRAGAEVAVRAGIRFIQFAEVDEDDARDIDAYLTGLKPMVSPRRVDGELSKLAKRGKAVFELARCATCHSGPMKTDRRSYPMPHATRMDKGRPFDTPTLVEIWRTAPYLYDGRAATMSDALRVHTDRSKALSREDFEALVEYLLSL
jgi:DNA-binding beta-propeller fold protein YncE